MEECKGIRLDVYAKDENNTHYNVEMQAIAQEALGKRARYYHSQIDMDLLATGKEYVELPDTYVIFICDFDPFGQRKYRYSFKGRCLEATDVELKDGSETIFLSTKGQIEEEVSTELVRFLKYVGAELAESTEDFGDEFVGKLQDTVSDIKLSRRMEERYMLTELLMLEERRAGRKESILEILSEVGVVPNELKEKIMFENRTSILKEWTKLAAKVDSIDQFIKEM